MSDDNGDNGEKSTNQARVHMETDAADGLNGNRVIVIVEGGEGETCEDINEIARERFEQAVSSVSVREHNVPEYH